MPVDDRPRTGSSIALSSVGSLSMRSDQSRTGSEYAVLLQRRTALRNQMAVSGTPSFAANGVVSDELATWTLAQWEAWAFPSKRVPRV